jgi:hypothetical protein
MHLLVVLQTHSKGDSQHYLKMHDLKRYCGADKPEVTRRCVASLVDSMNHAKSALLGLEIEFQVFDDHSDEQSLQNLKDNLSKSTFPVNLVQLDTFGIMPSILKCYEHGRDNGKDWVYFAQDDYLYDETAIEKMMLAAVDFSRNLNCPVSIYPFNDPYKYEPVNVVVRSNIVRSSDRHWRTQIMTASCFMTHVSVIRREWDLFEKMGKSPVSGVMEDESINQLFRTRGHHLFVPIPSLALHMQYSTEYDPLMDWRSWWDKYDNGELYQVDKNQKNLLNIGSGGKSVDDPEFEGFHEITADISAETNPDLILNMANMSNVPTESMDAIYLSHSLEHIDLHEIEIAIKSFYRILKDGGAAKIIVPNMKIPAQMIAQGKPDEVLYQSPAGPITALDMFYGHQLSIKHGKDGMRHKTAFTKEFLERVLESSGVMDFDVKEEGFDLIAKFTKNKSVIKLVSNGS